jgi:hypothetical protein
MMKAIVVTLGAIELARATSILIPRQDSIDVCPAVDFPPAEAATCGVYTSCANANWPPPGPGDNAGTILEPQLPDEALQAALAEVSAERIKETIAKLVSFGTRHTLSQQNDTKRGVGAARDWIASEFRRYAEEADAEERLKVEVPWYIQGPTNRVPEPTRISNVEATLRGVSDPGRHYVTLGHYDTRVSDVLNWWDDQPGANDDASGVASKTPSWLC